MTPPSVPRKLDRVGNDARQHGFEIESRADRLTDFAERFELAHRACQFAGSLIQFFEQADVLDGDHGLVGEGFKKRDLLVGRRGGPLCGGLQWPRSAHLLEAMAWREPCECQ